MKKVLALVLASAMAIGMSVSSFAANKVGSGDMQAGLGLSLSGDSKFFDKIDNYNIEANQDIRPMDEVTLKLNLSRGMFGWTGSGNLTAAEIRASKIAVRTQVKGGSKVLKAVEIDTKNGLIKVPFVDEWVSTKDQDFEVFVYLTIDGTRMDDNGVTITGTVANPEVEVYEDYDYIDLAGGYVGVAEDFVNKIEVDLGNGVSIFTKFFKGKKYYGTASRDSDEADDVVFSKYPDIDNVVTLKTVGLNSTGDIVKLDVDFGGYYVYDANLTYLGSSSDMLPYSTKYYLANKQLDIVEETDETDETEAPEETEGDESEAEGEDEYDAGAESGGDGEAAPNANANPGTGR